MYVLHLYSPLASLPSPGHMSGSPSASVRSTCRKSWPHIVTYRIGWTQPMGKLTVSSCQLADGCSNCPLSYSINSVIAPCTNPWMQISPSVPISGCSYCPLSQSMDADIALCPNQWMQLLPFVPIHEYSYCPLYNSWMQILPSFPIHGCIYRPFSKSMETNIASCTNPWMQLLPSVPIRGCSYRPRPNPFMQLSQSVPIQECRYPLGSLKSSSRSARKAHYGMSRILRVPQPA